MVFSGPCVVICQRILPRWFWVREKANPKPTRMIKSTLTQPSLSSRATSGSILVGEGSCSACCIPISATPCSHPSRSLESPGKNWIVQHIIFAPSQWLRSTPRRTLLTSNTYVVTLPIYESTYFVNCSLCEPEVLAAHSVVGVLSCNGSYLHVQFGVLQRKSLLKLCQIYCSSINLHGVT